MKIRALVQIVFRRTELAAAGGIGLAEQIKKGQFNTGKLGGSAATMPEICQVALAA